MQRWNWSEVNKESNLAQAMEGWNGRCKTVVFKKKKRVWELAYVSLSSQFGQSRVLSSAMGKFGGVVRK